MSAQHTPGRVALQAVINAVRAAAGAAGDASGNCDAAMHHAEHGANEKAAQQMEWAEENARSALHRITEARAAIANATGSTS